MTDAAACWAALVARLPEAAWLADRDDGRLLAANAAAAALLGDTPQALTGRDATALLPTLEDAAWWSQPPAARTDTLCSELTLPEWPGRPGTGETRWRRHLLPLDDGAGQAAVLVTLTDIDAAHRASEDSERSAAELRATLEATADGLLVTDLRGEVRAFNHRFAQLWAVPEAVLQAPGQGVLAEWMRCQVADGAAYDQRLEQRLSTLGGQDDPHTDAVDVLALLSGQALERRVRLQLCRGQPIGHVTSFRPLADAAVTVRGQRLRPGAMDSVTGLPDRPALLRVIDDTLRGIAVRGGAMAVLCVEVGGLAEAGRLDGERRLRDLARALRGCLRQPDVVARISGSRFGLLVHHLGDAGAQVLARRILGLGRGPVVSDALPEPTALTVGIAMFPDAGQGATELLANAERALRQCSGGGPGYALYRAADDPDRPNEPRLEAALCDAVDRGRMRVHFQPVVRLADGGMVAAEALLRWRDPQWPEMPPQRFLPTAHAAGLAGALDRLALRAALHQAASWQRQGLGCPVSVNLAPAQLLAPGLVARVAQALAEAQVPASQLLLEVREDALLADPGVAAQVLQGLARLGVTLVLDDFGAGFGALAHVRDLPFRQVKLARDLLRDVPYQGQRCKMVAALLTLADAMGVTAVAKGIENEAQRRFLMAHGCLLGQGHLFAAAQPADLLRQRPGVAPVAAQAA
jgi:predicted signal transduction protein with EAL and GGDEF domain/PAS domain-containing protein